MAANDEHGSHFVLEFLGPSFSDLTSTDIAHKSKPQTSNLITGVSSALAVIKSELFTGEDNLISLGTRLFLKIHAHDRTPSIMSSI